MARSQHEAITGIPELDAQIAALTKTFGEDLFTQKFEQANPIPTGSIDLDAACRIGGIPRGRIIEVYGHESSGKTSLCMSIASQYLNIRNSIGHENRKILIIDLEHSITDKFIEGFGIELDDVVHVRPRTAAQALMIARDLPKSGGIGVVIFDSVAAGQTEKQMEKDFNSADVGGISKIMHEALRTISKVAPDTETTYLFINQVTYKIGVMFGNPETTTGGKALPYYASMRLGLMNGKPHPQVPRSLLMRVKITKTKVGEPWSEGPIEIAFRYGRGPDPVFDTMQAAKNYKILRHAGKANMVKWDPRSEDWDRLPCEKKEGCQMYLMQNPDVLQRLREATMLAALGPEEELIVEEDIDEDTETNV